MRSALLVAALVLLSCTEKKPAAPPPREKPQPMEPLLQVRSDAGDDDPLMRIVPFTPVGPAIPEGLTRVMLTGEQHSEVPAQGGVLLVPDAETYLSQAAPLLAKLADEKREVWLKHPDADLAFKLTLRDAPQFQAWIDELVAGKVRVIHRQDGFELTSNMGKLPGGDPNGPTVPVRGGRMDLTTLQRGFMKMQDRFRDAPDVCFAPAYGLELAQIARAMSANYFTADKPYFKELCLVYPRPAK